MKSFSILISIILLSLIFTSTSKGGLIVQPPELSIKMGNEFIHGNTSKKIIITNNNNYSTNISWYLEHPNPVSWMRPNKTFIINLSWIHLNPKWCIIPPYGSILFYIYLDVPEKEEYLKQYWETWITFKEENQDGIFNQEYSVRTYIETPRNVIKNNIKNESTIIKKDYIKILLICIVIIVIIIMILTLSGFSFKIKKP